MTKYTTRQLREAATLKAKCQRMARDLDELLRDKALPGEMRRHMETLRASLRKSWKDLETGASLEQGRKGLTPAAEAEAKKTVDGAQYAASDFLVVEDPDKPTTWHLQVKRNGKVDRRLLGAAYAALTKGFRGNKYEGPEKGAAMAKLKKLYDDEGMEIPSAEAEEVAEGDYYGEPDWVPWGVISFAQLEATHSAAEMAHELRERASQFSAMVNNIITAGDEALDKPAAMRALFEEFMLIVQDAFVTAADDADMMDAAQAEAEPEPEPGEGVIQESLDQPEPLAESYAASPVLLEEAAPESLAMLDVQIIRPGWGNTRDNHHYPAEMLRRDAEKFIGAKMFETDHRENEKSTRTWVSTVKEIARFTDDGAPIARVVVHDPGFAERVRNLAAANLLEKMECSILASGRARPFEEAGRKGKQVDAITEVSAVDWVTRAGAGGHALNLSESAAEGEPEPEPEATVSAETDAPVEIHEQEAAPVYLAESAVALALGMTNLPPASVLALAAAKYQSGTALGEAIQAEVKRIKEISGSGRPFALGEAAAVSAVQPISRAKIEETMDKINSKFFGR